MHAYQHQDATISLRDGLREYFRSDPKLIDPDALEQQGSKAADLFRNHDVVHVVFGTDTSVRQEAMTDTWSMTGTDVGVGAYLSYLNEPLAIDIVREVGWIKVLGESLRALPDMLEIWLRSRRMTKKWPWKDHDAWLDVPLAEIRQEFGIEVFQPRPVAAPSQPAKV
ncbi:hypothetical protein G6O69_19960 [Pseudenhygromyxa sp. WMMC2535]|uniref:hypothetical protein n=1 Tax=Pseudenhygromyxa sp. WMMC2535 TaxID=2712867 RepID=UPI001552699D|nr:hypothetical protein [Pseudenhygromyxa sp. WMMC2535]NVB40132.1 hypothetical protein [Pseudenhygromyxa sp. WMMC2535]